MTTAPENDAPELVDLMRGYQAGNPDAAGTLVNRLSPQVFHFFLAQVRNRALAEDLLQDFWLRIHKARHTYRPHEPVLPWIFAIARRVQVDDYRRRSRIARNEVPAEVLPDSSLAASEQAHSSMHIRSLLRDLPETQRETVFLLKVVGLSLEEVARATGSSVGAVKQKSHRAFQTLRKLLRKPVVTERNASEKPL